MQDLRALPDPDVHLREVWVPQIVTSETVRVLTSSSSSLDEMTVIGRRSLSWRRQRDLEEAEFNRLFLKFGPAKEDFSTQLRLALAKSLGLPDGLAFRSDRFGLTITTGK